MATETALERRRAVLLDQHPLFLEGLTQVLGRVGMQVVGRARYPERALALVEEKEPDLLVTDVQLAEGSMDGISCIREARDRVHHLKAIAVSALEDPELVAAAFEAGAEAYVLKTAHPDDLTSAVRQAFEPSVFMSGGAPPSRAELPQPTIRTDPTDDAAGLTRREMEILRLAAEGHSNSELAQMLWVTEQTVKFHLSNIYRKLNVANRTEASRWAQLNGVLAHPAEGDEAQVESGSVRLFRPRAQGQ